MAGTAGAGAVVAGGGVCTGAATVAGAASTKHNSTIQGRIRFILVGNIGRPASGQCPPDAGAVTAAIAGCSPKRGNDA
ncbi:hypothetical protein GCM10028797_18300 [Dyella agri]